MNKKLLTIFLACALIMTSGLMGTCQVFADETTDPGTATGTDTGNQPGTEIDPETGLGMFTGARCTDDQLAASVIDYMMLKYKDYSKWRGTGQCWGFAEMARTMLAASSSTRYYTGLKFNVTNFKNKCLNVKAGTHLRLSRASKFNGGYGHSVVLLKVTDDAVYFADNNLVGDNIIAYHQVASPQEFVQFYGQYGYINMVSETTSYKTYAEPDTAVKPDMDSSSIKIRWTKTAGATRYDVYRSTTKTGSYSRVAKTAGCSFDDLNVPIGSRYYYKVKAVRTSGRIYGNTISCRLRLLRPEISTGNEDDTNAVKVWWEPVPKADRYALYRKAGNDGTFSKIATLTDCTYLDSSADKLGVNYYYKVKAICDANSAGNSLFSYTVCGILLPPQLPAPVVTVTLNEQNQRVITWNKVPGAESYIISMGLDESAGDSEWDGPDSCTFIDTEEYDSGTTLYYSVVAYDHYGMISKENPPVAVTIP